MRRRRAQARAERSAEDPALARLISTSIALLDRMLCARGTPIPQEAPPRPPTAAGRGDPMG